MEWVKTDRNAPVRSKSLLVRMRRGGEHKSSPALIFISHFTFPPHLCKDEKGQGCATELKINTTFSVSTIQVGLEGGWTVGGRSQKLSIPKTF